MANAFLNSLRAMGLYGNPAEPMSMEGIPPEMLQAARAQSLAGIGSQLLAAGMARGRNARAEALSGIADAADMSRPLYNLAQAKLMATPKARELDQVIETIGDRVVLVNRQTGEMRDLGPAPVKGSDGSGPDAKAGFSQVWVAEDPSKPDELTPYAQFNDGTLKKLALPPGAKAMAPADIAGGKTLAQTQAKSAPTIPAAVKQLEDGVKYIDDLLADPGLTTATGELQGNLPEIAFGVGSLLPGEWGRASSEALGARQRIKQVQGQAFLSAYETLKGTGQITEVEGAKAEAAKARLATAVSDQDYLDALADFRQALVELVPIVKAKGGQYVDGAAGGGSPAPAPDSGGAPRVRKWNPQTKRLE